MKKFIAVILATVIGGAVVGTAQAVPGNTGCPPGWNQQASTVARFDRNADGTICVKVIPNSNGRGNTGNGENWKDNNNP
jgi:hypothetical protein